MTALLLIPTCLMGENTLPRFKRLYRAAPATGLRDASGPSTDSIRSDGHRRGGKRHVCHWAWGERETLYIAVLINAAMASIAFAMSALRGLKGAAATMPDFSLRLP